MMHTNVRAPWLALFVAWMAACGDGERAEPREPGSEMAGDPAIELECDTAAARATVDDFGKVLARVSLLAPDSLIAQQVREEYTPFVTPELLERWTMDPAAAPGLPRLVRSRVAPV